MVSRGAIVACVVTGTSWAANPSLVVPSSADPSSAIVVGISPVDIVQEDTSPAGIDPVDIGLEEASRNQVAALTSNLFIRIIIF